MNLAKRRGLIILGIYALLILVVIVSNKLFPSDAHAPGLGILITFFGVPLIMGGLLLIDLLAYVSGNRDVHYSLAVHALFISVIALVFLLWF